MSVIGIVLMWAWLAGAFVILMKWPTGKESESRQNYWSKYEGK